MTLRRSLTTDDLPVPDGIRHPVIDLLLARAAAGSRRGERSDGALVAIAVEGGGLRGAVSAGMCVVLEQLGLIDAVDAIYGTSSGALNGSFTAAGQAALGSANYLDTASLRFANPLRVLRGRPALDFDLLFDDLIRRQRPYSVEGLAAGPAFSAVAVDLTTSELRVLGDFADVEELISAVRVSCSLPLLSGPPALYRGTPMGDGALIESIPFASALADGATHVLALRSRPCDYRRTPYPRALLELMRRTRHELYPEVVDTREEEGGVPSRLIEDRSRRWPAGRHAMVDVRRLPVGED
ncbi:MAG TPA: patatin-like phospholipase family protein, partial [Solirubrobacteraceae bacterium]|nr:patatin-like phospholipase family protein [Solirubrobacteraceae bacterium]